MKKIKASIKDQTLTIEQSVINVAGSVNAYALEIAYDAEWDEMDTKIVTFTHGPIRLGIQDDGSEDGVVIPHEVLTFPGVVTVGVVGYKDSTAKLTTTGLYKRNTFVVLPQALGLADALTPTPDIYVKLVNKLEELQGDYDNLSDEMGSLSDLETQNKDNLVAAINEVLNSGGGSGTVKSVNHKDPDADGNVALAYTDIPGRPSLATVATTGNYNDLTNKPTIPTVNDATLTIQKNGTDVATFTANSATNQTANIAVPTTASDIGAEPTIDSEHKLASDLVDDTDQTNKFATADDLSKLSGIESGAEVNDIDSISVNGTAVTPDEHKNVDITVPTYTAGANVQISAQNEISATDTTYTAGTNVSISNENVISATDTTYSNFVGTDGQTAGSAGLVPAPATTDAGKFLKADGTWDTAGGGGVTPVQTIGNSTTDVMSQDAVSSRLYRPTTTGYNDNGIQITSKSYDSTFKLGNGLNVAIGCLHNANYNPSTFGQYNILIGANMVTSNIGVTDKGIIAIGGSTDFLTTTKVKDRVTIVGTDSHANAVNATALGSNASASGVGSIAIGRGSSATQQGEMNIGASNTSDGYNTSNYRKITGVYDGENLHDCATVAQANLLSTSAPTTSTVGVLGQLYTDTTNMHTYQCTAIDTTDPNNPSYTWTQRW